MEYNNVKSSKTNTNHQKLVVGFQVKKNVVVPSVLRQCTAGPSKYYADNAGIQAKRNDAGGQGNETAKV